MSYVRKAFSDCCNSTGSGIGGALLSHLGCLTLPAISATMGGSISHAFMASAMYVTSPIIAVGATYGINKLKGQPNSIYKLAGSAIISFAMVAGINNFVGHGDHSEHDNHKHDNMHSEEGFPRTMQELMQGDMCITPNSFR